MNEANTKNENAFKNTATAKLDLSKVPGNIILARLERLSQSERKITHVILWHILEVEKRKLYFEVGYTSTMEYLKKKLKYADDAAYRRLRAAQVLDKVPEVEKKLEEGSLNLSQLTQVQKVMRQKAFAGEKVNLEQTESILKQIENKTGFETAKLIAKEFDMPVISGDRITPQKDHSVLVQFSFTEEEFAEIQKAKSYLSHKVPSGELGKVFLELARKCIQKFEGKLQSEKTRRQKPTRHFSAPRKYRIYIAIGTRRKVFERARYRCEFIHPISGERCNSNYQLQPDHIQPKWAGGDDSLENLRCYCGAHNRYSYRKQAGIQ